jgi:hypothetical protein
MQSFSEHAIERETGNPNQADQLHIHKPAPAREGLPARLPRCYATMVAGDGGWPSAYSARVAILHLLDHLPEAIAHRPGRVWNVFARSLGEQGADGRTALAWQWAFAGDCPSPVTLSTPMGRPPDTGELLTEASAAAELAAPGNDPGGQVMHARLVLQWLVGALDAVPLWNGGPESPYVTDGAMSPRGSAAIEEAYHWSLLACSRYPRPAETGSGQRGRRSAGHMARGSFSPGHAATNPLARCPVFTPQDGRRSMRCPLTSSER